MVTLVQSDKDDTVTAASSRPDCIYIFQGAADRLVVEAEMILLTMLEINSNLVRSSPVIMFIPRTGIFNSAIPGKSWAERMPEDPFAKYMNGGLRSVNGPEFASVERTASSICPEISNSSTKSGDCTVMRELARVTVSCAGAVQTSAVLIRKTIGIGWRFSPVVTICIALFLCDGKTGIESVDSFIQVGCLKQLLKHDKSGSIICSEQEQTVKCCRHPFPDGFLVHTDFFEQMLEDLQGPGSIEITPSTIVVNMTDVKCMAL